MANTEAHGQSSVVGSVASDDTKYSRAIRLNNGLRVGVLFRDAAQFRAIGLGREEFQKALSRISKHRAKGRFPGYEILEEIGRGGMGMVYRAREVIEQRIVALKCLTAADSTSDAVVARFRREAEIAASLKHRHIIPIYRIAETPTGLPFFAMKFASGGGLDLALGKYCGDIKTVVQVMHRVALGVKHAHERGILHRDLKPFKHPAR